LLELFMSQIGFSMGHSPSVSYDEMEDLESAGALSSAPPPMSAKSDARLRAMVDEQFDFIWRSLRRLGVPLDGVDDAAQRVFWVAAKNLVRIEKTTERAYLFGTAMRVASDIRRARARGRELQSDDQIAFAAHPMPGADELLDQKRARETLDRLLDGMPIDLRTVLILVEGEGLTGPEVADLLEIPEGTVNSRLRRAREALACSVERLKRRATSGGAES
jgi:RNA polymerase sigma-70 factor (ECF subfamily)